MDVTHLRGISRTAPYFHNNSGATLDEVLDHYDAFFRNVARRLPGSVAARRVDPPDSRQARNLAHWREGRSGAGRGVAASAPPRRSPRRRDQGGRRATALLGP